MIFGSILAALRQIPDPRFLRVLLAGIGLTLLLLAGCYAGFVWLVQWLTPDSFTLPWIGPVTWVDDLLSWASVAVMIALSVFLMVPVASAFTGLFLDRVAAAVEARHYPHLPPAKGLGVVEGLADAAGFLGVILLVNALALLALFFVGPLAPILFWAVNGYLLGREYFQLAAARRIGTQQAALMRQRNMGRIWLTGVLMAAPLTIPLVNLTVPVLGAAAFTHLFHRLAAAEAR
ncbi:EI24 domain-containing protein [Frigidibacter oleivorans]|uniref:EI24 domain-containing protein n=1 Tax=Frigidibacter oleivorans TaxID=2487129 RepID=UPI000F8E918A|nr:EI24 domain-containing protein [Frigidibacter oleivorans]